MTPPRSAPASIASPGGPVAVARRAGFTLIELMATLAVAGIVVGLGVPSFMRMLARHAIAAQAQELQDALRSGRNEAMKRSGPVVLCRTDAADTSRCAAGGGSWQTWLLFTDADRNGVFSIGDALVRQHLEASGRMRVMASVASVRFEATGIARPDNGAAAVFVLAAAGSSSDAGGGDLASQRQVCVNPRGEVVVIAGGATCP